MSFANPENTRVELPKTTRTRRIANWAIVAVVLVIAALLLRRLADKSDGKNALHSPPDAPVKVALVQRGQLPIVLSALGTVTPLATVTVKNQVAGQIVQVAFKEGQDVKKGDLLVQIDPRPYQAALGQAEGTLAKDEAALANAKLDLSRYEELIKEDSVSRQQLDTQRATMRQAEATLKTDQALIDTARVNLSYAKLISPIDGRVGLRKIDQGNYIAAGDATGLVVITQLHPISVLFPIPEDELAPIIKRFRAGNALAVTVYDRTGKNKLGEGQLSTIDNVVDTTTGTVRLRAQFANEDELLYPQQFVNVQILVDTLRDAMLLPAAGVQRGSQGTFVYVVGEGDTVQTRQVKLGASHEGLIAILEGVKEGERVVVDGTDRLRDGTKVIVAAGAPVADASSPPREARADATR
ncbi:MAG: MdtA/MuxA family multidrug efflux RND transporter periplasmic adaptor subunit [Clostridia bacterium]|nr:MdtA/MuxA family multidrug efflux RND transporter periplasmic adaptor subunit [Deltaproteobacteria bacterium]